MVTHSPVEVDTFLGELALTVGGVLKRFILDHLHPLTAVTLLMAVLADHIQLANPVLERTEGDKTAGCLGYDRNMNTDQSCNGGNREVDPTMTVT